MVDISREVRAAVEACEVQDGIVTVFCPHTTAAITINENADPSVTHDMMKKLDLMAPRDESYYTHMEGNSDSHVKSSLVGASEAIILEGGELQLGTWQGIYFCEFDGPRSRTVWVTVS
jgi:secondary thiamine-phosphate synthase enzyme